MFKCNIVLRLSPKRNLHELPSPIIILHKRTAPKADRRSWSYRHVSRDAKYGSGSKLPEEQRSKILGNEVHTQLMQVTPMDQLTSI